MDSRRFTQAALAIALGSATAAQAQAIRLWDQGQTPFPTSSGPCPSAGAIPMGDPNTQGFAWKNELMQWIRGMNLAALEIPGAQAILPSPPTYPTTPATMSLEGAWLGLNPSTYLNVNQCHSALTGSSVLSGTSIPGETMYSELESVVLHSAGDEWVAHGMARMNVPSSQFDDTLLENQTTCQVHVPALLLDPELTSWAAVPYSGNPYFTDPTLQRAVLLRGAIYAALHLVIMDYLWWTDLQRQGEFPCDPAVCPAQHAQNGTAFSPFTGELLPMPGMDYIARDGQTVIPWFAGNQTVHDFSEVGGPVSHFAYTYILARDLLSTADLPLPVRAAFERALLSFADRMGAQGVWGVMPNMAHRSIVALWLVMDAQSSSADRQYAESVYRRVAADFYSPTTGNVLAQGTFRDVSGFDTSYNNYNLLHMARLMAVDPSPDPGLVAAAHAGFDLWGHLIFPDPYASGATFYRSPSAYNSRTPGGAVNGGFGVGTELQRLLLAGSAGLPWAWAGLAHGKVDWDPFPGTVDPWIALACDRVHDDLHLWLRLGFQNTAPLQFPNLSVPALDAVPPTFPDIELGASFISRAYQTPNFAFLYRDSLGLFGKWDLASRTPGAEELPFELTGNGYYRDFANAFFYGRPLDSGPNELVSLIHAGPVGVSSWGAPANALPDGYGGGQLSALWSPDGGPMVLARRRGRNGTAAQNDDWAEWRSLPVHAASVANASGALTSTSRAVAPVVTHVPVPHGALSSAQAFRAFTPRPGCLPLNVHQQLGGPRPQGGATATGQYVSVCGEMPLAMHGGPISTRTIPYRRDFLVGEGYVAVQTRIWPLVSTPATEAWETIPLYYGSTEPLTGAHVTGDYAVTFHFQGGSTSPVVWDPTLPIPPLLAGVTRVEVQRYGGTMDVVFERPQSVTLSPAYDIGDMRSWNLMVDLLGGQTTLPSVPLRYRFDVR
jgi:hypothetical protein